MTTLLGQTSDGRMLTYDASLYEFYLEGERAAFADVQTLDARNWLKWRAAALRDWFRHINSDDLSSCNRRARALAVARGADGVVAARGSEQARAVRMGAEAAAGTASAATASQQRGAEATQLRYRSTDEAVATVDARGIVRIAGPGSADIYACRVGARGAGPEMRVVTIAADAPSPSPSPLQVVQAAPAVPAPLTFAKSFKAKGGKLSKDKEFMLPSEIGGSVTYRKVQGSPFVHVSEDGCVRVQKGLVNGTYKADVEAISADGAHVGAQAMAVTVKIK